MDASRICRIAGRLCFLGAVAFSIYWGLFAAEQNKGEYTCFEQMQIAESKGYINWGNYYFCLDTRTRKAYSPLDDPLLMSEIESMVRAEPSWADPGVVRGMRSNAMADSTKRGVEQRVLIGNWNVGELFKLFAFCAVLIVASFPIGFYSMKLLVNVVRQVTK